MCHKLLPEFLVELHLIFPNTVKNFQYNMADLSSCITKRVNAYVLYVSII
jgi:hypothetical protein